MSLRYLNIAENSKMDDKLFYNTVIEHFNMKGVKFTFDEIAHSMMMSKMTIYKHYGNKEAVMLGAVEHFFNSCDEASKLIAESAELDLFEKLKQLILNFPMKKIELTHLRGLQVQYPVIFCDVDSRMTDNWKIIEKLFLEGFEKGLFKKFDLEVMRVLVVGAYQEVWTWDAEYRIPMLERTVDFLIDSYR